MLKATSGVLTVHRTAHDDVVRIATGNLDHGTVTRLRDGQRSARLLLLRAVLDAAAERSTALSAAWDLLVAAERANRAAVFTVLDCPLVGVWAARALRLLCTAGTEEADRRREVGHLHAIAAAAAIRAKVTCRVVVPMRDGTVPLPTLGTATFSSCASDIAEVHHDGAGSRVVAAGETVAVPDDPTTAAPGWLPLRQVCVHTGTMRLRVWLDDIDPYRELTRATPPRRLDPAQFQEWLTRLADGWRLLTMRHPQAAAALAMGLTTIVPGEPNLIPYRPSSSTSRDGFGCARISLPDDPRILAEILVHEFRHSILNALSGLVELHDRDDRPRWYAPWRDDPRPIRGLLLGAYSFVGVADLWRNIRHGTEGRAATCANFEFAYRYLQTREAIQTLLRHCELTEPGRAFVETLNAITERWRPDFAVLPTNVRTLASRTVCDHRAMWRLRNLRPGPESVAALARAWLGGSVAGVAGAEPELRPDRSGPAGLPARAYLTRSRLSDQRWLSHHTVPGATPADLLLISDQPHAAAQAYTQQISDGTDVPSNWVGLGLALDSCGRRSAATALLDRPELTVAVYRQLAGTGKPPKPAELAAWLGAALVPRSR